jgi:hypothetical protein
MSESIREEITRDVLEYFGIDLSKQELAYHDKTKPVWTQQILDKKSLKTELDSFLIMVEKNLECFSAMIKFEKEYPSAIVEKYSHEAIMYDLEFLWICESHVKKFEKEKYLTQKEIAIYQVRIQKLKNKIRAITIDESLKI